MTVQELIDALAAGVRDGDWEPDTLVTSLGPNPDGHWTPVDLDVRVIQSPIDGELLIIGAGAIERAVCSIDDWIAEHVA